MSRIGEFQPADAEEDRDAMEDEQERREHFAGIVKMTGDELRERMDSAALDGYAEGRKDGFEEFKAALEALRELVTVKQLREEVSRRKQRRECSIFRNPAEVHAVATLHQECKAREFRAWNFARSVIANTDKGVS